MDAAVLRLSDVTKRFAGRTVVDRLSFEIRSGEVFALLGPNGAGKTTIVRMLVGMILPDEGRIEVGPGDAPSAVLPPEHTGYLPEDRGLYRDVSVLRTLVFFGMLRGLERRTARQRAEQWLERTGLLDRANEKVSALSKGNQQRVQLIAAVLHNPRIAILDEPFAGLDPIGQEFFLELLQELKQAGTTILLSAHQMDLVERAADRVLLMNHGRTILAGDVGDLRARAQARARLRITLEPGQPDAESLLSDPDIESAEIEGDDIHVTLHANAAVSRFLARVVANFAVMGIATETPRLHDLFVRAVRADDASREGECAGSAA